MNEPDKRWTDVVVGVLLAGAAFVAYAATLSGGAFPGESARLIVQFTGLSPKLAPDHPLWGALVWALSQGPEGHLAVRLNWLSALCGAGSVYLLYRIMVGAIYGTITVTPANRTRVLTAARLAGVSAALFLTFSVPFWVVSNRAHNASFDALILLAAAWLLYRFAVKDDDRYLYIWAFLYGLGIVECATFIVMAPVFGLALLYLFLGKETFRPSVVINSAFCGLSGLSLYLIAAWFFYGSVGYHVEGYSNFFQIVWIMWRDQVYLIGRSLPQSGWLVILITTIIPWLTCLVVARRALNEEKDWTYYILHVVMTGLAVGVLFNVKFAPWSMLGLGRLLVTPYLLTASVFGYLIAYWYLLPGAWWEEAEEATAKAWGKKWLGLLVVIPGLALLCLAPGRNIKLADGRSYDFLYRHAEEVINCLSGRTWLVTDGVMDDQLLVAAKETGCPVKLLNTVAGNNDLYMRYVATLFDNVRLKNLAALGMMPLLKEWFSRDPDIDKKVAVRSMPDLWTYAGFMMVPNKLVFFGMTNREDVAVGELVAEHEKFWRTSLPALRSEASGGGGRGAKAPRDRLLAAALTRHVSLVANDLGVFLEDVRHPQEAFAAYGKAREIDPENISALLNQLNMIENGYSTEKAEAVKADADKLLADLKGQYRIWSLSQYYGYVRMPEAFAQRGLTWALSGQPGLAISELKAALDLLPADKQTTTKRALASMYLAQREDLESESLFVEVLAEAPDDQAALAGLARVAIRKGDLKTAADLLRRAESSGMPKEQVMLERASLLLNEGKAAEARQSLEQLVKEKPEMSRAWALLIDILVQQNDQQALGECLKTMEDTKTVSVRGVRAVGCGYLALMRNDFESARKFFETALVGAPDNAYLLEILLRLDVVQSRRDDALRHAKDLLRTGSRNAFGHYVLASIQMNNGQYDLAEDSLRRSLEIQKTPQAENDLAWLLQTTGAYAEAEKVARSALKMNDKMYQAWDTLGVILMKTKRLEEAQKALDMALSLFLDDMSLFVHLAELQALKGNPKRAAEFADRALERPDLLSPRDRDMARDIRSKGEK